MFIWQIFFKIAPHNGAMKYFDSAKGNDILSVHYQIGGYLQKLRGVCVNFICKLNISMLANSSMKNNSFAKKAAKIFPPPTFSMEHLLHRLYGVDAPVQQCRNIPTM